MRTTGESGSVIDQRVIFAEAQDHTAGWDARDIFNADETGFYIHTFPKVTLAAAARPGIKLSKEQITCLLFANALGETLRPVVVCRSARPRCSRGDNAAQWQEIMPRIQYCSNPSAWITNTIFTQAIFGLDTPFACSLRCVVHMH